MRAGGRSQASSARRLVRRVVAKGRQARRERGTHRACWPSCHCRMSRLLCQKRQQEPPRTPHMGSWIGPRIPRARRPRKSRTHQAAARSLSST